MARLPTDLEVGIVGRAHGVRGELMVRLLTNRLERVAPGAQLRTGDRSLVVERSRPHQKGHVVAFEGVRSRTDAEALSGAALFAEPIDDPDTLWVHELIGARLRDVDGTDRGTVVEVQDNPAADLMVTDEGALVPLTFYVERQGDVIVIDPPAGLFDLE